ncbi:MAG TPA: hypothetical protein DEF88_10660 [Porphyromonadaceae bacterium]|jgi:hypothetical protein|nr:hypothetical protein [Porphyromonadaceae bacterium]HCM21039.1 hypothetical protein [Porphyromonadaceae bacterium]
MKKRLYYIVYVAMAIISLNSCSIDNYDWPEETLKGRVVDAATGDLVLTDQGSEGIRIRLKELSWKGTAAPENFDFWCMKEGIFQNTKIFKGHYNVRIDGAFIPLLRLNNQGDTIADETKYIDINGVTEVEFQVQPFLKLEWMGQPTVKDGKITASFIVNRGVSPQDFKEKIEPMGNYSDEFLNITDVRLFVSQVPYVGYREWDNRYSVQIDYPGNTFEESLGKPITITSNGSIPAGRTIFIRAAARINYATEGVKRHNYNEALRVDIPSNK